MKKVLVLVLFILCAYLVVAQNMSAGQNIKAQITSKNYTNNHTNNVGQNIKAQITSKNYTNNAGQKIQIQKQSENQIQLKVKNVTANTSLNITANETRNRTRFHVRLSNGRNAEIKIMPDTASKKALERLRLKVCNESNNCTLQLKEIRQKNQTRIAYEMQVEQQARIFGIFKTKMQVQAQVDAEDGEIIQIKRPWWSFLATKSEE